MAILTKNKATKAEEVQKPLVIEEQVFNNKTLANILQRVLNKNSVGQFDIAPDEWDDVTYFVAKYI